MFDNKKRSMNLHSVLMVEICFTQVQHMHTYMYIIDMYMYIQYSYSPLPISLGEENSHSDV